MQTVLIVALTLLASPSIAQTRLVERLFDGFTLWVDCDLRAAVAFFYLAEADSGSHTRHGSYLADPEVSADCQSLETGTFQAHVPVGAPAYDVGHQVPANHFDGSEEAIRETNYWTNLLPQTASMNRGAWRLTEDIIECLRDEVPTEVWGGAIWAGNVQDDYFIESHGIPTPSAFWKVIIRTDNREAQAWIIPNGEAPRGSLDNWLQSVATIESITGMTFDVSDRSTVPEASWSYPRSCNP